MTGQSKGFACIAAVSLPAYTQDIAFAHAARTSTAFSIIVLATSRQGFCGNDNADA